MINAGNGEWEMKNREREMGRGKKKGKLGMENGIGIFFYVLRLKNNILSLTNLIN